jgi:hypothetical protein
MELKLRLLSAGFLVLIFASMASVALSLYQGFNEGDRYKRAQAAYRQDQETVWHNVICLLESATKGNKKATPEAKQAALLYYDQILVLAHAAPCPGR